MKYALRAGFHDIMTLALTENVKIVVISIMFSLTICVHVNGYRVLVCPKHYVPDCNLILAVPLLIFPLRKGISVQFNKSC